MGLVLGRLWCWFYGSFIHDSERFLPWCQYALNSWVYSSTSFSSQTVLLGGPSLLHQIQVWILTDIDYPIFDNIAIFRAAFFLVVNGLGFLFAPFWATSFEFVLAWLGPSLIVSCLSRFLYSICLPLDSRFWVHLDHLKPYRRNTQGNIVCWLFLVFLKLCAKEACEVPQLD